MNFKALRKYKLKLSQQELAKLLNVDISKIKEWETSNDPPTSAMKKIAKHLGTTLDEVSEYEKPKIEAINVKNTWEKVDSTKKNILKYIEEIKVNEEQKELYIKNLQYGIEKILVKPTISIVGRSDTGKSTLINSLMGMDKMPTSWTPTTSIAVYIKHINDRPDFIKEDVWIFADGVDGEKIWNVKKLYDREYCEKWWVAKGSTELLRSFGTRQGDNFEKNAGSAVVFLDAPILQNCDIIDLPGFGTGKESDDDLTNRIAPTTDILIYLSQANGFMRNEDIIYLKENIRNLPIWEKKDKNKLKPFSNLFIVASQAHTVDSGNDKKLNNILDTGYKNFCDTLAPEHWSKREEISGYEDYKGILRQRFYTYTIDIPRLCNKFNEDLKQILEELPKLIDSKAKDFINDYKKRKIKSFEKDKKYFEKKLNEREDDVKKFYKAKKEYYEKLKENEKQAKEISEYIDNVLLFNSKKEFRDYYAELMKPYVSRKDKIFNSNEKDKLTAEKNKLMIMMEESEMQMTKEGIENFTIKLQDIIQTEYNKILDKNAKKLSEKIEKYIKNYNKNIEDVFSEKFNIFYFDAGYKFVSILSKIGVIGGLGAFATSFTTFLITDTLFISTILTDALIVGGTLLAPVAIGIGIISALGLGVYTFLNGGWRAKVSERIIKAYEENEVLKKFEDGITDYWKQTKIAFNEAIEKLNSSFEDSLKTLERKINTNDVEEIENNISLLNYLISYFENIPL